MSQRAEAERATGCAGRAAWERLPAGAAGPRAPGQRRAVCAVQIGDEGATALSAALTEKNATLTELGLDGHPWADPAQQAKIGDKGATAIAAMLGKNATLKRLAHFHNAIGPAGGRAGLPGGGAGSYNGPGALIECRLGTRPTTR